MFPIHLRPVAWKILLACLVAFGLVLHVPALYVAAHNLGTGRSGGLGVNFHESEYYSSRHRSVIEELHADSPLRALGAKPGDEIVFDRFGDRRFQDTGGGTIGLSLIQSGQAHHHVVKSVPLAQPTWFHLDNFVMSFSSVVCMIIALAVGMARADSPGIRLLALALVGTGFNSTSICQVAGPLRSLTRSAWFLTLTPYSYYFLCFSLRYPDGGAGRLRAALLRWQNLFTVLTGLGVAFGAAFCLGFDQPWNPSYQAIVQTAFGLMTFAAMWETFHQSRGQLRQRAAWLLVGLAIPIVINLPSFFGTIYDVLGPQYYALMLNVAAGIQILALSYAILRHRVFDFGFAVNRTLVFSVTSLLLVLAFWLVEQVAHKLVHVESAAGSAWLSGGIAFGLFFAFNRLHHRVDHWIEHLFFRQWRAKEEALRKFLRKAAHFTAPTALIEALGQALEDFSDGAGHAIYVREEDGSFRAVAKSLASVPEVLEADADVLVCLRTEGTLVDLADTRATFDADLAFPMFQGAKLEGMVLLGHKRDSRSYRPDERALLTFVIDQVALDLQGLIAAQLARELRQTRHERDILLVATSSAEAS